MHTRPNLNAAPSDVFADGRTAKRKLESDVLDVHCVAAAAQLLACGGADGRAHERRGFVRVWKVRSNGKRARTCWVGWGSCGPGHVLPGGTVE